ncbi:mitochondrial outer membrane protein porin 2-like [Vicia villosa]|uniref:mitochondrial outer membrane protein porin 2-like n=1 Tax=Vicia villosa TaxID=3911 RepID=UPI00273B1406|nr:mitochondrial outer membrane protein porin 2-like [Vicia villosa]
MAAARRDFVSEITLAKESSDVVVRVIQLWFVTDMNSKRKYYAMEMVLLDEKVVAVVDITRKFSANQNTITVGGSFAIDPLTQAKIRFNNYGKLGGQLQHEIFPKSVLNIFCKVGTKSLYKNPKFGFSIDLKP